MKPVVQLVSAWSEFAEIYPEGDLQTFCLYQIEKGKASSKTESNRSYKTGGLLRIIGRLSSAFGLYHRAAMTDMGLPSPESFFYLNSINMLGEVRKTELINYQFAETTTGMAAILKLVEEGMISERSDPTDARARLIKITDKGKKKLKECTERAVKVKEMFFNNLDDSAIDLCTHLLSKTEQEHSKLAVQVKNKPFEEMYAEVMGKSG